jgi:hypothetical protein
MSAYVVSKPHIDLLVQAAIAGPSDGHGWKIGGEPFSYYHDSERHAVEIGAEPGERSVWGELVGPSVLGQRLTDENVTSVEGRYPDTNADRGDLPGPCDAYYMGPYVFEAFRASGRRLCVPGMPEAIEPPATIVEIAKAVSCYEYQSCEHDGWETSEAHAFCQALTEALLHSLPGYDAAPWGFDERVSA